jgi:hypothetical protein
MIQSSVESKNDYLRVNAKLLGQRDCSDELIPPRLNRALGASSYLEVKLAYIYHWQLGA